MYQKTIGLFGFVNTKIITAILFFEMYFDGWIESKLMPQLIIQLQTKLMAFDWRNNAKQTRVIKKIFVEFVNIEFQFHTKN